MAPFVSKAEGPLSLREIKEALAMRALANGFLSSFKRFLREMQFEWGETETAHAELRAGKPVVQLGREFFAQQQVSVGEAVDIVMHEILHHVFLHLRLPKAGYSRDVQNVAMDAVINAYLHKVGCANFMARFYPDEGVTAFLRPLSTEAFRPRGWSDFFSGKPNEETSRRWRRFYGNLYDLRATLEEALAFFAEEFPKKAREVPKLGNHKPRKGKPAEVKPTKKGGSGVESGLFAADEAESILEQLGVVSAGKSAKRAFAEVVRKITTLIKQSGSQRAGTRLSRRVPAKLGRGDMLAVERGRDLFVRGEYRAREVWIFPDLSGSMTAYVPFIVDLVASLRRSDVIPKVAVWADRVKEVSLDDLKARRLPDVGGGTDGEAVARFLAERRLAEVVIVTDNYAGDLTTIVRAKTHVCLIQGSAQSGSFLDRAKVPFVRAYELKLPQ